MNTQIVRQELAEVALLPIGTAVLWTGCLAVGTVGLLIPYSRATAIAKEPEPIQVRLMQVELSNVLPLPPDIGPPPIPSEELPPAPPELPENVAAPAAPPLIPMAISMSAVAMPSPRAADAAPADAPTRVVEPDNVAPTHLSPSAPPAALSQKVVAVPAQPQRITFGQGEGRQPAPEYPREAALARQHGTVVIQFTVGEDGRVQAAKVISSSPFPLLNQAAVRAVHEDWRFRTGPVRTYEVSIQFDLKQR